MDNKKVEKVARALAAMHGDPDALVTERMPMMVGKTNWRVRDEFCMPLWKGFVGEARVAIRAMEEE